MTTTQALPEPRISPEDRTHIENVHGQLLHEAHELERAGNYYDASVARARALFLAKQLGWDQ